MKPLVEKSSAELIAENRELRTRIKQLEEVESALRETEMRYSLAMKGANEGLWDWDPVSKELFLSARLLTTIGMGRDTLKTTSHEWLEWVYEPDRAVYQKELTRHLKGETEFFDCEYRVRNSQGGYVWVLAHGLALRNEEGVAYRMVGSIGDITERKDYEQQLLQQANYDFLTGLPNRVLAMERLEQALIHARQKGTQVGVLFVDLDNFKKINDTLGHEVGDRHLKQVSQRLNDCMEEGELIARLGGDEFMVVLPGLKAEPDLQNSCQRILDVTARPVKVEGYEFVTTASIGITLFPDDGDDPGALLRNADAAMYSAKASGKNAYCFFTPEMEREAVDKLAMESALHHALERRELDLHYQGIFDLSTGQVVGAEALLRWNSPEYGAVPPDKFIPLAEESGLIIPFGDWVLEMACRQAVHWRQLLGRPFYIAVNVAFPQFRDGYLVDAVRRVLYESQLPPEALELELTERLLMEDERGCKQALEALRAMGVRLSIDDFGTGYSALNYLKRFPVDTLKIDRGFIADLTSSAESPALISAIIKMAHALGLNVVGEGIETETQQEYLRSEGCDLVQGFYLSKPLSAAQFEKTHIQKRSSVPDLV